MGDIVKCQTDGTGLETFPGALDNLTAHAGGGQANALQLTKKFNWIENCASDHDSVKLPAAKAESEMWVSNFSSHILDIYPSLDETIISLVNGDLGVNNPDTTAGTSVSQTKHYVCFTDGIWKEISSVDNT